MRTGHTLFTTARITGIVALALGLSACVSPGSGGLSDTTRAPRTTTSTTMLPPATLTDYQDPIAPGLGNGGYDVQHYHIDLAFTLEAPEGNEDADDEELEARVGGTTTIDIVATEPVAEISFDFTGSTVSTVRVDGEDAEFTREPTELIIALPTTLAIGDAASVEVTYTGAPDTVDSRVARTEVGWVGAVGGTWNLRSEPDGAHRWFPANDHPSDKATFLIDLLVPIEYAAGASGTLEREYSGIESSSYRWAITEPVPASSVTAIIGDLQIMPDDQASVVTGIDIRHLLPAAMVERPPAALAGIPDMMSFFEERFGPYPFGSFGVAVVDGPFTGLGANTWAVMTADQLNDEGAELTIVNRLARHWFGDSLTPATWSDVWLSTTFTRYAEWLWVERDLGDRAADTVASAARRTVGDSGWPRPDEPKPGDAYVGSVFLHGAITLHAMRLRMGDSAFFDMISTFHADHAGGWATTADFETAVLKLAGSDIRYLYDAWLSADELPGFPDR